LYTVALTHNSQDKIAEQKAEIPNSSGWSKINVMGQACFAF
jgi:hypothetical protein